MPVPSLARLSVSNGTGIQDLPLDVQAMIQMLVHSDNPCRELVNQCLVNKQLATPCRNGTLYEATNLRMGWYGTHSSLAALQQDYDTNPVPGWTPPATAKAYFLETCRALREAEQNQLLAHGNPYLYDQINYRKGWYGTHANLAALQEHYQLHPIPNWTPPATAQAYAAEVQGLLRRMDQYWFNVTTASFGPENSPPWFFAVAKHFMLLYPAAFTYVEYRRPDLYYDLARATLERDGEYLQFIKGSLKGIGSDGMPWRGEGAEPIGKNEPPPAAIERYSALAKIAVTKTPKAIRWVPLLRSDYDAIAVHARRALNVQNRRGVSR